MYVQYALIHSLRDVYADYCIVYVVDLADNRKKFKNLTIKSREHVKTATDDELKSIKLQRPGGPGSSAVKTGSSASLDGVLCCVFTHVCTYVGMSLYIVQY